VTPVAKLTREEGLSVCFLSIASTVASELNPEEMVDIAAANTAVSTAPASPGGRNSTIYRGKIMSAFFSWDKSTCVFPLRFS
jgi:hypothetical protein